MPLRTIPILPANAPPVQLHAPRLSGEPARLQEVLLALSTVLKDAAGRPLPIEAWVRELRLESDEAYLAVAPGLCVEPAERAFDVLRRLLPDTDIYMGAAAE